MKRIIGLFLAVFFITALSYNGLSQEQKSWEKIKVVSAEFDQHTLHMHGMNFFAWMFKSGTDELKRDLDEAWIMFWLKPTQIKGVTGNVEFKFTVNLEDGGYEYFISDLKAPKGFDKEIDAFFTDLCVKLENTMKTNKIPR